MLADRPKQHHSAISVSFKYQICEWAKNNKNKKYNEIASYFNEKNLSLNINHNIITKILAQSKK